MFLWNFLHFTFKFFILFVSRSKEICTKPSTVGLSRTQDPIGTRVLLQYNCHAQKHFRILTDCYPGSFSIKARFYEIYKIFFFFFLRIKQICTNPLTVYESTLKIKETSAQLLFEILPSSAVICKQKFLNESKSGQSFQGYKYSEVDQGYFGKFW